MSDKRDYILKCGLLGLLGASLFSVGSYLWKKDFFLGEEPSREVIGGEHLEAMRAEAAKMAEIRKFVQPCFARSNDMLNLAASGTARTSDFLAKAKSAKTVCEEQLSAAGTAELELSETQQLTFSQCRSSLELEIERAKQLSDFAARPQNEVGQSQKNQMIELRDRAIAQRAACESSLASSGFMGQLSEPTGTQ